MSYPRAEPNNWLFICSGERTSTLKSMDMAMLFKLEEGTKSSQPHSYYSVWKSLFCFGCLPAGCGGISQVKFTFKGKK